MIKERSDSLLGVIEEIRFCLKHNKLRIALGMALTLPDICGKVEFKNNNKMKDNEKYIEWCKMYLKNEGYATTDTDRVIDPKICYKLRCAYLHSGNTELNQREKDNFPFFKLRISSTEETGIYVERNYYSDNNIKGIAIDVRHLCNVLCNSAELYYEGKSEEEFNDHNFAIIDIEETSTNWDECKSRVAKIMEAKKDPHSYDELTMSAKVLLDDIKKGKLKQTIPKSLKGEKDKIFFVSVLELYYSGFIKCDT